MPVDALAFIEQLRDKAIQDAVAARVEKALFAAVDVEAEVRNVLPDRAQLLAAPISSGIQTLVSDVIDRLVRSDRFARLWDEANRLAAQQVLSAGAEQSSALSPAKPAVPAQYRDGAPGSNPATVPTPPAQRRLRSSSSS